MGSRANQAAGFLAGGGKLGELIASRDWSSTTLGPIAGWPAHVRSPVALLLRSPIPIVTLWGEDGVLIYNDAYAEFAGARHPGILGAKVREAWPEVADFNDNVMKTGLAGDTLSYRDQELSLARDGLLKPAWLNLDYSPLLDAEGAPVGVIAIVQETTEKVMVERRLSEQQARLTQMFSQAPGFMALLRGPEHIFELVNPAYMQLVGHREIVGMTVREALPDIAGQGFYELLDEVFSSGVAFKGSGVAASLQRSPGAEPEQHVLDFVYQPVIGDDGKVDSIFVQGADVTDRVRAEAAIQESEAQFRAFAQAMPHQVWAAKPDGMLDWFNDRVYEYSGAKPGSLDGQNWGEIVHSDDFPGAAERWAAALAEGEPYEAHFRVRAADTSYRWHLARAVPIRGDGGEIVRWIGTNTDVEEQRRSAQAVIDMNAVLEERMQQRTRELLQTEATLRQSQKMEAVGKLTGGIAHDFNNMLAVVMGALNLIERRQKKGEPFNEFLVAAQDAARRAADLTLRLLAFSRQLPLAPQPTDVAVVVKSMSEMLGRTLGEQIQIETVLAGGLWKASTDINQLENAILNLSINARDAMPDGGKLTIETSNAHLDDEYARSNEGVTAGQYVLVAITDTGTGMSAETAEKAFEPFFTTKGVGQGTGLGLSQVFGYVRQSQGHIKIYSELGKGSTIRIYLPRSFDERQMVRPSQNTSAMPLGKETDVILLVDDEARMREISAAQLRELGYSVIQASSGAAALEILKAHTEVGLLLTDIVMPEMGGRVLADEALKLRRDLKIIFTTGYTRNAIVHNGVLDPGVNFISKPFTMDQLARKVRDVLSRS